MKQTLFIICLLAFYTPSVLTACQDYKCNYDKAKAALNQKNFKEALASCKAAKSYTNVTAANIVEADALIYKIFEAIQAQQEELIKAKERADKNAKSALMQKNTADSLRLVEEKAKMKFRLLKIKSDSTITILTNFLLASNFDKSTIDSLTNNYHSSVATMSIIRKQIDRSRQQSKIQNEKIKALQRELQLYKKDYKMNPPKSLDKMKTQ